MARSRDGRPRLHRAFALGLALTCTLAASVSAAPGDLDRTFGAGLGGRVTMTVFGTALARQADGKLIVAGDTDPSNNLSLVRFLPDGGIDPSFGVGGTVTTSFPLGFLSMIIQADGKIVVVAGFTFDPAFIVRFETDGTLDSGFGSGGSAGLPFASEGFIPRGLIQQADGMLVIAGDFNDDPSFRIGLARFQTNGTLDPGFGSGGTTLLDLDDLSRAGDLIGLPGGKLLVVGQGWNNPPTGMRYGALARLLSDGTLDPTFGTGGVANTAAALPSTHIQTGPAVVQPDGKVLVSGSVEGEPSLLRYESDGSVDTTFGGDGLVVLADRPLAIFPALLVQPNGKIVFTTYATLVRLLPDGSPDPTFGQAGEVANTRTGHMVLLADQRIGVIDQEERYFTGFRFSTLARYYAGTCGNGTLEAGEDCDDGNLTGGDGCDASCCVADADGDGRCDSDDPCVGSPLVATTPKILLRGLLSPLPKLTLQGQISLPLPFTPALDPVTKGIRLVLEDADEPRIDLVIPGGAYTDPPKRGWKVSIKPLVSRWTYIDKSTTTPATGISKVVVTAKSATNPGSVKIVATGKNLFYAAFGEIPLSGLFALDGPAGQCATLDFPGPPTCTANSFTGVVACK